MYKFQKVQLNWKGIQIDYDWMLVLESLDELINYHQGTMKAQIRPAWNNLDEVHAGKSHISTNLGMMINFSAEAMDGRKSLLELTAIVGGKIFEAKAHGIINTGKIYINKKGGCFPHSKDLTILDEMLIDKLIFPQYTLEDIDIQKWQGGKHWYAYIGGNEVEVDGVNKWSTPELAKEKAKSALYRLQQEQYHIKGQKIQ